MAAGHEMRVSDAEREAAAAELREHFASGRLNQDELNERLDRAFAARTRGDLNALFTDLPSSGDGWSGASAPGGHPGTSDGRSEWDARRADYHADWRAGAGHTIGRVALASVLLWVLLILGILGVFGIGTGRPFGIVLIIAAFALLRRLLFVIFGRRRRGRRGPRRRR